MKTTKISREIEVHHARFHQPVPHGLNKEPVSEFKLNGSDKYLVQKMTYTELGLFVESANEKFIVPQANIIYVRI